VAWILWLGLITSQVWARQDGKPVIGFIAFEPGGCRNAAFHRGMRELGYEDGKNMVFDCRHAEGRYDGLDVAAAGIVRDGPDVIVALGHAPALAMQHATKTIPVVTCASGEPVASGLVQSLARPGGNITGVSYFNTELNIKRLELLKTAVPGLKRLAVLIHAGAPADLAAAYIRDSAAAGKRLGFETEVVKFAKLEDLDRAFAEALAFRADGMFIAPMREVAAETKRLVELSHRHRLPVVHFRKSFATSGGLMSYGVDYAILHHRTATYVDKILKGANPAELPVEQPARFELHINMGTARKLGLTVPDALRLRADKVIE
jgi:putative ABC transport system substrate-binding protein